MRRPGYFLRAIGARGFISAWVLLLFVLLAPLKDTVPHRAQVAYNHAWQLFLKGRLALCQQEAERDSRAFEIPDPSWAAQFRLLEAEAMVVRGKYAEAFPILMSYRPIGGNPDGSIRRLTLEAVAYIHQQQFSEAELKLTEAESLCNAKDYASCGGVLRARGVFLIDHGQPVLGKTYFLKSLIFARAHHDKFLETTSLTNLGWAALHNERYDESVDWSRGAYRVANELGAEDLLLVASGNLGWAYFELGDRDRALELFLDAEKRSEDMGDTREQLRWLENIGYVHQAGGDFVHSAPVYAHALELARQLNSNEDIAIALEDLAYASIDEGRLDDASAYLSQLAPVLATGGDQSKKPVLTLAEAKIAARRRQDQLAERLLRSIESDPASETSVKLDVGLELARLYELQGRSSAAEAMYRRTLATFEAARAQIKHEDSQLPFLENAEPIYDGYIHFLVSHGKTAMALAAADQSRARTLAQGLGLSASSGPAQRVSLDPGSIARKASATLLFYWLGERESYLWAVRPDKTSLFVLPSRAEITARVERYRQVVLAQRDPLAEANEDGRALYATLVSPAASFVRQGAPVVILADGVLSQLNFETLLVPGRSAALAANPALHYWIDDAAVASAPSLAMLASAKPPGKDNHKLLLLGNAASAGPDFPELPMAGLETRLVQQHFAAGSRTVWQHSAATPAAYFSSNPQQFSYIHFVAHGVASRTDPLESAIILSRSAQSEDSFKLYARDIITHPMDARLVTISACYGSGTRFYAGEGLIGLSWGFLRAGAHNVIAALWDVSDESTPRLMDALYQGLEHDLPPSGALRQAKLVLAHSEGEFRKPFFWAPFQLYVGH